MALKPLKEDGERLQLKIAALLHDPPEKAGVLFGCAPHESISAQLLKALDLNPGLLEKVKWADRMAAGADRFPLEQGREYATIWRKEPLLTHPLSGQSYDLGSLESIPWERVSQSVREAISEIARTYKTGWQRYLALWRLLPSWLLKGRFQGPLPGERLGLLWSLMPADTRIPDHSIWEHNRLTSAIAGSGPKPGLLFFSVGPVQSVISAARKASDLWAGSALLAELTKQAVLTVVRVLGPDTVIFPDLWGHQLIDEWLKEEGVLDSDPEPVPHLSIPNQFLAIVPAADPEGVAVLAGQAAEAVRNELSKRAGERESLAADPLARQQVESAIDCYWTCIPWEPLFERDETVRWWTQIDRRRREDSELRKKLEDEPERYKYLNSGSAFGSLVGLMGAALSAVKFSRLRVRLPEPGQARCLLCGERTARIKEEEDRLCAFCAVKRDWGTKKRPKGLGFPSTATVAAALWFERLADAFRRAEPGASKLRDPIRRIQRLVRELDPEGRSWLPESTLEALRDFEDLEDLARADARWLFPDALPVQGEKKEDRQRLVELRSALGELRRILRDDLRLPVEPRRYFALFVADGDSMGKWVSGENCPEYDLVVHRNLLCFLSVGDLKRPYAPAYQAALSRALGNFARELVPHIVEKFSGALVYAGGDDVLAMFPLGTAATAARAIRYAFSGEASNSDEPVPEEPMRALDFRLSKGFAQGKGRLLRLMGGKATLSAGLVVSHYKFPLRVSLETARESEELAKRGPGKNAVALAIIKRSGDREVVLLRWPALDVLNELAGAFRGDTEHEGFRFRLSRRFVSHLAQDTPLLDPQQGAFQLGWLIRRHLLLEKRPPGDWAEEEIARRKNEMAGRLEKALSGVWRYLVAPESAGEYPEDYFLPAPQLVRLVAAAEFFARERDE